MTAPTHHAAARAPSAGPTLLSSSLSFSATKKKHPPSQPHNSAHLATDTRPQIQAALDPAPLDHASHSSPTSPTHASPPPPVTINTTHSHSPAVSDLIANCSLSAPATAPAPQPDDLLDLGLLSEGIPAFDHAAFAFDLNHAGAFYSTYLPDAADPNAQQIPYPPVITVSFPLPTPADQATPIMSEPPPESGDQQQRQQPQQPRAPPPLSFPISLLHATSASNSPQSASGHLPPQPPVPQPPAFTLPPLPPSLISTSDAQTHPYPLLPPGAYGPIAPTRKRTRSPSETSTSEARGYADLPFADASPSQLVAEGSGRPRRASLPSRSGTRVTLACVACRNRKIKCNGEKPICENCIRRGTICEYDAQPRRRGPDKNPGGRVRKKELAAAQALAIAEGRPPPADSPEDEPESPKRRRRADTGPREGMVPGLPPMPPYPYAPPGHSAYPDPRFAASIYGAPPPPPAPHMEYGYGPPPGYIYANPRDMNWLPPPPPFEGEMQRQDPRRKELEEGQAVPESSSDRPGTAAETTASEGREEEEGEEERPGDVGEPRAAPAERGGEKGVADPAASAGPGPSSADAPPAPDDKGKGRATDMPAIPLGLIADPAADADSGTM